MSAQHKRLRKWAWIAVGLWCFYLLVLSASRLQPAHERHTTLPVTYYQPMTCSPHESRDDLLCDYPPPLARRPR